MKRSGILVVLSLLSAVAIPACSSESSKGQASADSDLVARVLADSAEVHPDSLVFPTALVPSTLRDRIAAFQAAIASGKSRGDIENVILLGDRSKAAIDASGKVKKDAANPYGYMRRALSIREEGGKTTIVTEQASLDDAFAEFNAGQFVEVGTQTDATGVSPLANQHFKTSIPVTQFDGMELFREGDVSLNLGSGFVSIRRWARYRRGGCRLEPEARST